MARRITNFKLLNNVDISATKTSNRSEVSHVDQAVIFVYWTGTSPIGVITVQGSNDSEDVFRTSAETWQDLDFGSTINVTGNTGDHQLIFNTMPFKFLRIIYTTTSGVGNLTAHMQATSTGY